MLRIVSLFLSTTIMLQSLNFGLSDVLQMDELLEHANFHAEKYGDNFFDFLSKHYGDLKQEHDILHQEEKGNHEELPLNHQLCSHFSSFFIMNITYTVRLEKLFSFPDSSCNFIYKESYSLFEKPSFFQPPRYT